MAKKQGTINECSLAVTQNLGEAWIWEALEAMAPLHRGRDLTMNVAQRLICAIMNGAKDLKVQ